MTALGEPQYLRIERAAASRSEFVDGMMFAVPGATIRHARLAILIACALGPQPKVRIYASTLKVRTPYTGAYLYPTLSVVAGPSIPFDSSNDILTNPQLIVEVASPVGADYIRGTRFELYQQIPSFTDYLIVYQPSIRIDHYARQSDGSWIIRSYQGQDARLPLPSIECELHLGSIYSGVMDEPA